MSVHEALSLPILMWCWYSQNLFIVAYFIDSDHTRFTLKDIV